MSEKDNRKRNTPRSPLSKEAQQARCPLPVEQLFDALNDLVHYDVGRARPARVVRVLRMGDECASSLGEQDGERFAGRPSPGSV